MGKTTRKISRLAKLGALSSKISGSYLSQKIRSSLQSKDVEEQELHNTHLENAERIVDVMVDLKGAAMKVGQSIAVIADSLDLPKEVSSVLSRLNDQATLVPFEKIEEVVRSEFADQEFPFLFIDPVPLGTASLAQAHAATLHDGTQVVIKVLHEGVEDSVDTDLQALKKILQVGRFWKRSREEIDILFDEIRIRLLEELDYEKELLHLQYFYRVFENMDGIRTPYPYQEYCTKRVLTMQRLLGMPLEKFCEMASDASKKRAGDLLCIAFHEMAYVQRALHADPHGGNYLFQKNGNIGILDFGCVKKYDQQFISLYSQFGNALVDARRQDFMRVAKELEIIPTEVSLEVEDALWDLACAAAKVFQQDTFFIGSEHDTLLEDLKRTSKKLLTYSNVRGPRNMIFLHRSLMGIYSMLRKIKHFGHYEQIRRTHADLSISVFSGEKEDVSFFKNFE